MKLLTKGLVVTIIPFILQAVFVCWLLSELARVQTTIASLAKAKEIASNANLLFLQTAQEQLMSGVGAGGKLLGEVKTERLDDGLEKLEKASIGEPTRVSLMEELKTSAQELVSTGRKLQQEKREAVAHRKPFAFFPHSLINAFETFYNSATAIVLNEQKNISTDWLETELLIQQLIQATFLLLILSALLAAGLGWFYVASIRRPLIKLMENSRLLARRERLPVPASGSDELSTLEQLLYQVSLELEEVVARERELLARATAMVASLNDRDIFTEVNAYARTLLGSEPETIIGHSAFDFISDDDIAMADSILSSIRSSSKGQNFDLRLRRADGTIAETSWSVQFDKISRMLFCVIYDISELKKIERFRQELVQMVSQDLRQPLLSMASHFDSAHNTASIQQLKEPSAEISSARKSVQKLSAFLDDFLALQKLSDVSVGLKLEEHSLQNILADALEDVEQSARAKDVKIAIRPFASVVVCDRIKVHHLLENLLTNAIKFSPAGKEIVVYLVDRRDDAVLCVADEGPGIAKELQSKIFEAFEQAPGLMAEKGTGLGLAICKMIVSAHQWTITAENRKDSPLASSEPANLGSIFSVTIPNAHRYGRLL